MLMVNYTDLVRT